jgi:hypothetical protein
MKNNEMTYGIWAEVSGGVTGSRAAWLKSNGEIREFATREGAEEVAAELNATMGKGSSATFRYTRTRTRIGSPPEPHRARLVRRT